MACLSCSYAQGGEAHGRYPRVWLQFRHATELYRMQLYMERAWGGLVSLQLDSSSVTTNHPSVYFQYDFGCNIDAHLLAENWQRA